MANEQSFDDAFNEFAGGTPADDPVAAEPEVEATQDAEPAEPAQASAPDPEPAPAQQEKPPTLEELLSALPADKAERYKPLVEGVAKEMHRLRSDAGRVSAMQHLYHEQKARAEAESKRAAEAEAKRAELEARAAQPMTKAQKAEFDAEADEFAKEFPEFSNAVNMRFENLLKKHLSQLQPPTPAAQVAQQVPQQAAQAAVQPADTRVDGLAQEYAALSAAHPDWQQASASPVFAQWKAQQAQRDPALARMLASDSAADAIRVLDRFKVDLSVARKQQEVAKQADNRKRLEQNVSIKGAPARPAAVPNEFEAAFNYYASKDARLRA
jgi:hypothetical protein